MQKLKGTRCGNLHKTFIKEGELYVNQDKVNEKYTIKQITHDLNKRFLKIIS